MRFPLLGGVVAALAAAAPLAAQRPAVIELDRMRPTGLLVDRYSYMAQPYSYHYLHHVDELGFRLDSVRRGGPVTELARPRRPFRVRYQFEGKWYGLDDYFRRNHVTGFLVLADSQIVTERYLHDATAASRFVSQSVGKSIVSILVGAAVDRGLIGSVGDPIVKYLPELAESGYRDATVEHVLQMATGVAYSENYRDSTSGAAQIGAALVSGTPSLRAFVASMRPTEAKPGTRFEYQSVNTQALGLLVERVTGKRLNEFAAEALWSKLGAEADAYFYESRKQPEICAFACFNATIRDYGRVGLMMMRGGLAGGERVISEEWVRRSTTARAPFLTPDSVPGGRPGYGYQWWLPAGRPGTFEAVGIYGQSIFVDPSRRLVIVQTSAWPEPIGNRALRGEQAAVREAIAKQVAGGRANGLN